MTITSKFDYIEKFARAEERYYADVRVRISLSTLRESRDAYVRLQSATYWSIQQFRGHAEDR